MRTIRTMFNIRNRRIKEMTDSCEEQPRIARDINLQIRLNEFENNMLSDLAEAYGLKRTDVIRRLIRDEWMSLTRD